jgi:AcrR family transcriptional regulator
MLHYAVNVGRPKEHDQKTAVALLDAAEQAIQSGGIEAVSVRRLANSVGTTTRAVYSLFGSKDGLLVAMGARAFEILGSELDAMPESPDPVSDFVDAGVLVFRGFVIEHPTLYRIGFGRGLVSAELATRFEVARRNAWRSLLAKAGRLEKAGLLGARNTEVAASHFNAMCVGLAEMELYGALAPGQEEHTWRDALHGLIDGIVVRRTSATETSQS